MKLRRMNKMLAWLSMLGVSTTCWGFSSDWELVFNDEFSSSSFNGNKLDWDDGDWNKISYVNWGVSDWRKYQSRDDSLVVKGQSDGVDYVTLKGSYGDYTSQDDQSGAQDTFACGGIFTDKTFSFQYGYVEVRARFESAQGVWPAIWLMPKSGGWPDAGEIDMMEHLNFQNQIWQTLHLTGNSGSGDAAPSVQTQISNVNGWHTYGMEWTADSITFYIDGNWTATFRSSDFTYWPFDDGREFYLLIDQQIGGSWPGNANADTLKNNSADFDIDFVRVFSTEKNSPSAASCPSWSANGPVEKNGAAIQYTEVSGVHSGALDQATAGNYSYSINGALGRIVAEDSNIRIAAQNGGSSYSWVGDMVQCRSLHIADGKFSVQGNSTFDVDTLYVVGGSLEMGAANALNSVEHLYYIIIVHWF
ncbi:MAG: glycoside hydrolase family 16 protein, partial [Akkermansia sp.]|nr:glycoside hydrolase family 16 protein [Akkermansia sp.]